MINLTNNVEYDDTPSTCRHSCKCDDCFWDCDDWYQKAYKVININDDRKTALVKGECEPFHVKLTNAIRFLVHVGDLCTIERSVTGEYLMTDYTSMFGGY